MIATATIPRSRLDPGCIDVTHRLYEQSPRYTPETAKQPAAIAMGHGTYKGRAQRGFILVLR